jgi:DNA polymerase-3 subunit gamma/tau
MAKALYRKYRSKSLSEIIGQEHITDTLDRALKQGMISHAYLLTGPRGVGKTSIARILAYEVNGLPYDEEATHLDIIEIDAASNRRIDEIRELNERIHVAPTSAKYKVYIIDEVHMLTKEAFNALLKTLEEPPEHAIFILATTEAHKVPETILSRTQRFTFKPVDREKVVKHLKQIAESEKITIDNAALGLIAEHGEGSFRDSISLLDQVRHTADKVTLADVQRAIGQAPHELMDSLVQAMASKNMVATAQAVSQLRTQGIQAPQVAKQLALLLRAELLSDEPSIPTGIILPLLADLLTVSSSQDPELALELALYGTAVAGTASAAVPTPVVLSTGSASGINSAEGSRSEKKPDLLPPLRSIQDDATDEVIETQAEVEPEDAPQPTRVGEQGLDETTWPDVLAAIKSKHNTLYGITRMAEPVFESEKITLRFAFPFHQKRLSDAKNMKLLSDIITGVIGKTFVIDITLDPTAKAAPAPPAPENPDLKNISNIFGGAEIVN